ncbi:MAG: signal peptidase I [Fimbriimonas sp.]
MRTTIDNLARTPLSEIVIFVVILSVIRLLLYPYLAKTKAHQRGGAYKGARFINEVVDAFVYAGVFVFMIIRPFALQTFLIPSGSMIPTLLLNDFIVANKWVYRFSDPKVGDIVVFRPPTTAADKTQIDKDGNVTVDFIKRCIGVPGEVIEIRQGVLYRNGKVDPDTWRNFTLDPNSAVGVTKDGGRMQDFKFVTYSGPYAPLNGKTIPVVSPEFGQWPNYQISAVSKKFQVGLENDASNSPYPGMGDTFKSETDLSQEEMDVLKYLKNAPPAAIPAGNYLMMGDNRNGSFDGRGWGLVPRTSIIGKSEAIWLPLSRLRLTR